MTTHILVLVALALTLSGNPSHSQILGSDNAGNYTSATWTNGSTGGFGFGAWSLPSATGSTNGFSGNFIGGAGGLSNYSTLYSTNNNSAFSIYAGGDAGAFQDALRPFSAVLNVGETFSHSIAFSFDNGNKGFDLYSSTAGTGQVFNFNIGGSGYTWSGGGTATMTPFTPNRTNGVVINLSFTRTLSGFNYTIGSAQDAGLTQSGDVAAAGIGSIKYYISGAGGGDPGNLYFNNLQIIPEPSTPLLMGLGLAGLFALRKTRKA